MYYLKVKQSSDRVIIIDIRRQPEEEFGGSLSVIKKATAGVMEAVYISPNVAFNGIYAPDDAREISDWWRVAAAAAETLDALIKTREDLARPVRAWMVVKTVVIEFEEAKVE